MTQGLFIGDLARRTGLPISTIRYYERRGLLPTPKRRDSGYREYPSGTIERLRFIRRGQELGFTLDEIGDLLSLRDERSDSCREVRRRAEARLIEIDRKIDDLERMRDDLARLVQSCRTDAPLAECPIIEALDHRGARQ